MSFFRRRREADPRVHSAGCLFDSEPHVGPCTIEQAREMPDDRADRKAAPMTSHAADSPAHAPGDPDGPPDLPDAGFVAPDDNSDFYRDDLSADGPHWKAAAEEAPTERIPFEEAVEPVMYAERPDCWHCRGRGKVLTVNDLLQESMGLLGNNAEGLILKFYAHLVRVGGPALAELFPPDLIEPLSAGAGKHQRDLLLAALVMAADLYDPTDPDRMARLDANLKRWGERHAAFDRSDGTDDGARPDEYDAVKTILMATLHEAAGEAWLGEYDAAWAVLYHHMKTRMLNAQIDYRLQFPDPFGRTVRR